jgi:superfamily II RNA helicase
VTARVPDDKTPGAGSAGGVDVSVVVRHAATGEADATVIAPAASSGPRVPPIRPARKTSTPDRSATFLLQTEAAPVRALLMTTADSISPPSTPGPPLAALLPARGADPDDLLSRFVSYATASGLSLYPAQEEALLELMSGKHVVLNTPTGSGKSLVAAALHFKGLAEGKTSFYTSPVKALVNEKFFDLCRLFGAERVGMLTGDASINRDAPIVCCTAEILANMALRDGAARADYVVMDEFHYYADRERGVAWQIPLLCLPQTTFLLMSATLGDLHVITDGLTAVTGREVATVRGRERPVPLKF